MFNLNQFRNALESVAQQPVRILDATSSTDPNGDSASHSSLDMQGARSASLSSTQLAESAMSSLRKSFASQRVNPVSDSAKPLSPTPATRKSTLEERLRRAAQVPTTSDTAVGPQPRGRSDSVASQTKQTSSRVTSSSPATRGRPADVPNKLTSRTASPAVTSRSRLSLGSKPPSRSSSPAPASKPLGRSSPGPASRNPSTTQRAASPAPTRSRTPSRPGSPASAARTRHASELSTKCPRAPSPSPLARQIPLRRGSIVLNNTSLSNSSITTSASTYLTDSKEELSNVSSGEETSLESIDGNEEDEEKKALDPSTKTGISITQSGDREDGVILSREEEESQTRTQSSPSANEHLQSKAEPFDNTTDVTVDLAVAEVSANGIVPSAVLQTGFTEVSEQDQSTPHQETGAGEASVFALSEELSKDQDVVPDPSFVPVVEEEKPSEAALPSCNSKPNIPSPELATTLSESPKTSTNDQEIEQFNALSDTNHSIEVENLQARLKEVEQRFSDVSTSFKRLQAEKLAADAILKENSHLDSFNDVNALRDYFANLRIKDEVFQGEIKRLTGKLELEDDRLQDLRETQKLETQAHFEELRRLKTHLNETEALFEAAQRATTNVEEMAGKQKQEILTLEKELEQSKNLAKEEEEKRVKAITLLKTVRQKLVKAEKDKEDAMKEMASMKEREKGDKDKEQTEKLNLLREFEVSQSVHAQDIASLRAQFEEDLAATRERYEQEIGALKAQYQSDLSTVKTSYNKELASKSSHISTLENSLNIVTRDKNTFFDQLQLRQAELESAQAHLDTTQHQNTELEFQLREAHDRLALVREEYAELQREAETRSREPTLSAEEIARMVSATEVKYEARITEMKRNMLVLEKERHESEVDWSRKLKEKVRELEDLKRMLGSATKTRESEENMVADLKSKLDVAQDTIEALRREVAELTLLKGQIEELKQSSKEQEAETDVKIRILERQIDEHKAREAQLKQGNKTLREELRKVQSSAALLERQRNPGVGYWGARTTGGSGSGDTVNGSVTDSRVSVSSPSPADTPSRPSSPTPSSASTKTDEELNLEYVRNVVLQFLEHKERRPQLVKVLSIILHFTPQETRRLIAKV